MTAVPNFYERARAETLALFRWNPDSLTPDQVMRVDLCTALRLALDDQQGRLARGETVDVSKLLAASEALSRFLPPPRDPPPPAYGENDDPRQQIWETYQAMRARGALAGEGYDGKVARIAELEAEVERLTAALAEPTLAEPTPPPPPAGNVLTLSRGPSPPPASVPPSLKPPLRGPPEPWRAFYGRQLAVGGVSDDARAC
jgi:hypothetical protein